MKSRYEKRCERLCLDRKDRPRSGETWVHFDGQTQWVCMSCAEALGRAAHMLTAKQKIAIERRASAQPLPGFEPVPRSHRCPKCGQRLVERHNHNTGRGFLGCSAFPMCGYTVVLRDAALPGQAG